MKPIKFVVATLTALLALSVYAVQLRKECEDKSVTECIGEVLTWATTSTDPVHEEVTDDEPGPSDDDATPDDPGSSARTGKPPSSRTP